MNLFEKTYASLSVIFAVSLILCLFLFSNLRQPAYLIPIGSIGFTLNVGLMFIVLRDIFLRSFGTETTKFFWMAAVLIFWPSIVYYLLQYGMKPRASQMASPACDVSQGKWVNFPKAILSLLDIDFNTQYFSSLLDFSLLNLTGFLRLKIRHFACVLTEQLKS
jgi:hypothetical protein